MRKQYKKARYKRAAMRKADRKYPEIKTLRRNLKKSAGSNRRIGKINSGGTEQIDWLNL